MTNPSFQTGLTLKSLRLSREWSLTRTAKETGVSKAMLGQIERGESSPTVATLWKIATGFNVPFSHFIPVSEPQEPEQVMRSGQAVPRRQRTVAMQATPLFPYDTALHFDVLAVELIAGAVSESSAHETGVIEHVVVTEGELQLAVNGKWHTLKAGEGLRFQADCPHSYLNVSLKTVKFLSLIHYPQQ
ncbi:helix-turn-helix domain-containing protein [Erwinia psidii]|uniref:XRE family transcriptional regulator n=1 Tax=Erwinia psidii TaxID=69224 RepID=A0A3N6UXQ1_9GAMM|nr:XRE family transcriptional regulator [Erwinia psidii]MCX8955801.1 XRE family transcriptional regulator [Erwinia psidii]MCX8961642.1 XRE family transcriptional regulator [Erwinia psidii]MCX8965742.1 XRE family transcriptional regulator [Erwinia psidii]RQM37635.1 XRE family transcriptional regulator [Erwinia psidii]